MMLPDLSREFALPNKRSNARTRVDRQAAARTSGASVAPHKMAPILDV